MIKVENDEQLLSDRSTKTYVFFNGIVKIELAELKVIAGVVCIAIGILIGIIAAFNTPLTSFDDDYTLPPYQIWCTGNCGANR